MADSSTESVSPRRFTSPQVRELREHYWPLMPNTRQAAIDSRAHLAMQGTLALPGDVKIAGGENWISRLPHQWTMPQKTLQDCIARRWEIKRSVTSGGFGASSVSSRLEQPLNAIMKDDGKAGFPWASANDLILNEGIAFSTVALDPADWQSGPSLYIADSGSLEPENIQKRFSFDAEGRLRGDDGYDISTVDLDRAAKLAQGEMHDHLARHLPFRQTAVSIRSCAPIWKADSLDLEGLIIESWWTEQALLRRKISLSKDKDRGQLYPLGALGEGGGSSSAGSRIKILEAWMLDEDSKPYVVYCGEGKDGPLWAWQADGEPWIVDLSRMGPDKNKALTRLPVSWGWGLGWPAADLDERAMTLIAPFLQSWRNIDSLLTAVITWAQWRAFPSLIEKDPIGAMAGSSIEDDEPEVPQLSFMSITKVTGDVTEIGTQGIANGVLQAVGIMMGEVKQEQPGGEQQGGASGFAMSLGEAFAADALTTVHESVLKMASMNASFVLEGAKLLGEAYEPIRVYNIADVLIEQKKPSPTRQLLMLDPELIGDSFDVKAVSVKTPGENPAVRQQNAGLVKEGFYSKRWFLEQDGYPDPDSMAMEVAWDELLSSDPGKAAVFRMLEQFVSDEFTKQITDAITQGQANPTTGLPAGYAQGMTGPPPDMLASGPQAGQMPGLSTPNPAAASLNGAIAGGLQQGPITHALQNGGVMPVNPMSGGI